MCECAASKTEVKDEKIASLKTVTLVRSRWVDGCLAPQTTASVTSCLLFSVLCGGRWLQLLGEGGRSGLEALGIRVEAQKDKKTKKQEERIPGTQ